MLNKKTTSLMGNTKKGTKFIGLILMSIIFSMLIIPIFESKNSKSMTTYAADFNSDKLQYGFTIDDNFRPIYMNTFVTESYTINDHGSSTPDYYFRFVHCFLVDQRDSTHYAFVYRVEMTPYYNIEYTNALRTKCNGAWWYNRRLKTTIQLRDGHVLNDWAPKSKPSQSGGSIGVGLQGSTLSISAQLNYTNSELNIYNRSRPGDRYFEAEYSFDRSAWDWIRTWASEYLTSTVVSYGMILFSANVTPWVDIVHNVTFADAHNRKGDATYTYKRSY